MATGFGILFLWLIAGGLFGIAETAAGTAAAALISAVLALAAGIGTSLYGPAPSATDITFFEAMRRPDGETLYDQAEAQAEIARRKTG